MFSLGIKCRLKLILLAPTDAILYRPTPTPLFFSCCSVANVCLFIFLPLLSYNNLSRQSFNHTTVHMLSLLSSHQQHQHHDIITSIVEAALHLSTGNIKQQCLLPHTSEPLPCKMWWYFCGSVNVCNPMCENNSGVLKRRMLMM